MQKVVVPYCACPAHEEGDTKIVNICQVLEDSNITIKCSDTHIHIKVLSNMYHFKSDSYIWIEIGITSMFVIFIWTMANYYVEIP